MKPIKLKMRTWKLLQLVVVVIIYCQPAFTQDPDFTPDRDMAERAFNSEDYITALKHYKALSERFSADPVYKYYTGASMVELKQNPDMAKTLLREAIINSSSIRQVPSKAWYFLGRAYQLAGDFDLAIDAYDTYKENARRKEIRALGIDKLISECDRGLGDILDEEVGIVEEARDQEEEDVLSDKDTLEAAVEKQVGDEYEILAREALEYQFRADSLLRLADRYRSTLNEFSESDRQSVRSKILSLEQSAFEYQRIADQKYREAAGLASDKYDENMLPALRGVEEDIPEIAEEKAPDTSMVEPDTIKPDTITETVRRPAPVLEVFSEEYGQQETISVNPELPEGLIYRIQLAAFRNPKEASFFKGLGPISIYRAENTNINFYYAGMFRSKEDAERALVKVKKKGFNDAFILALMDGSRISMEQAEQLEKKWSDISLFKQDTVITRREAEPEEPPTLVYRVQVLKVKKKVEDDKFELLEKLADKKNYDILETADKEYVYLIGKFLTFESAAAYADLLYRNGLKESKVVAYLGNKEIPLETAKKLFELYFDK